jgi:predicted N-acetyltransferase YhbS
MVFRPAVSTDVAALVDLESRAFNRDTPDYRATRRREMERELSAYVLLLRDEEAIACARIQRDWLRVGRSQVLKGDVGHVAVKPELHGQGLGTEMMQQIIAHLREHGFHLSRLGGLMKFYARFGYEPFLRRFVHIPVPRFDEPLKGGAWRDRLGIPDSHAAHVRPFHPALDHDAVHRLRYRCSATRSGGPAMAPEPSGVGQGEPNPEGLLFVYDDGEVRGWLQGHLGLVHAGDAQPSYRIDDLAYDPTCPQAVGALVKALMERAQAVAPTTLVCRLPYDEALFAALNAAGIACDAVELRQALDGNMVQVLNLSGTLGAIAPELTGRVAGGAPWQGVVRFILPGHTALLQVTADGVRVANDLAPDLEIQASHADFVKWLFGIVGFAESPQATPLTPPQRLTLSLLFPRLPCASGPWG